MPKSVEGWSAVWPTAPGFYWVSGYRFKDHEIRILDGKVIEPRLDVCRVVELEPKSRRHYDGAKFLYIAEGHCFSKKTAGICFFKKLEEPLQPKSFPWYQEKIEADPAYDEYKKLTRG